MAYALKQRQELGHIIAEMRGMVTKAEKEKGRGFRPDEVERYHALLADHDRVDAIIRDVETPAGPRISNYADLEEVSDTFRLHPRQQRERATTPADRAFANYVRFGMERLSQEDRELVSNGANMSAVMNLASLSGKPGAFQNAQSTSPGSAGGYIVPQGFSNQLEVAMKWFGGNEVCGQFTTETGNPFPWPTINDTANSGRIVGQNAQVVETDLNFGQVTFNAFIGSSDLVLIPLALMQDSYFDLNALLARLLGTRLGRLLNTKCTVGSGTNEPTGIVTASVAAGNVVTFTTGETSTITYANLVDIESAVDPAYRENPSSYWMFSDAMLKVIKKLVDGNNRPLWQPGLTASFANGASVQMGAPRPTILGHPYVINQDMAAPAANSYSILFGDMSTFKVRRVGNVEVMRLVERYADYLQVGFLAWLRFDSNLIDAGTHPVAVGRQSAS